MNINDLALVKVINKIDNNLIIKPGYTYKKIKNTKLYDTILNKIEENNKFSILNINNIFNDINKYLPYSMEYNSYNTFYINTLINDNDFDNYVVIIESLKNQIENIDAIDNNKVIIKKEIKLSKDVMIFTNIKKANKYLKNTYNKKFIYENINILKKQYDIKDYIDYNLIKENIDKTNRINKLFENDLYYFFKNKLQLDENLSLLEIVESIDINRYKCLIKSYNKKILKRGINYEEK